MMDGIKIGVILRDAKDANQDILKQMNPDHILLKMRSGKSRRNGKSFIPEATPMSFYVPASRAMEVFTKVISNTIFIENDNGNVIKGVVSKILEQRPDTKIGIVTSMQDWVTSIELSDLMGNPQVFMCPFLDSGSVGLALQLDAIHDTLPGSVPILMGLSTDDQKNFRAILGRIKGKFDEIIFFNPNVASGVDFTEVIDEQIPGEPSEDRYIALFPVALRVSPTRASKIRGAVVTGDPYTITNIKPGILGCTFGQIVETGLYVIMHDGQTSYFEKETIQ